MLWANLVTAAINLDAVPVMADALALMLDRDGDLAHIAA
jgi:hypothetical protein